MRAMAEVSIKTFSFLPKTLSVILSISLLSACAQDTASHVVNSPPPSSEVPTKLEPVVPADKPAETPAAGDPQKHPPVTMLPIPDEPVPEKKEQAQKPNPPRSPAAPEAPAVPKPAPAAPAPSAPNSAAPPRPIAPVPKNPSWPDLIPTYIRFPISLLFAGAKLSDIKPGGFVHPTVYYNPIIRVQDKDCKPEELVDMATRTGKVILKVCPSVRKACVMQGSCILLKEKEEYVLNADREGTFVRVRSERCPYGLGMKNTCLDPFFTVAADPKYFNVGDVIFVPRVVNILLPNNIRHNGFFIVRDGGGMIQGADRFDFFTGFIRYNAKNNPFTPIGLADKRTRLEYYKVDGQTAKVVRQQRGYPNLPEADRKQAVMDADEIIEDVLDLDHLPARGTSPSRP